MVSHEEIKTYLSGFLAGEITEEQISFISDKLEENKQLKLSYFKAIYDSNLEKTKISLRLFGYREYVKDEISELLIIPCSPGMDMNDGGIRLNNSAGGDLYIYGKLRTTDGRSFVRTLNANDYIAENNMHWSSFKHEKLNNLLEKKLYAAAFPELSFELTEESKGNSKDKKIGELRAKCQKLANEGLIKINILEASQEEMLSAISNVTKTQ